MSSRNDCRIYVGNLPPDIRTKDVEDLFYRFGKVVFVDLKNRRGEPIETNNESAQANFFLGNLQDPRLLLWNLRITETLLMQ